MIMMMIHFTLSYALHFWKQSIIELNKATVADPLVEAKASSVRCAVMNLQITLLSFLNTAVSTHSRETAVLPVVDRLLSAIKLLLITAV